MLLKFKVKGDNQLAVNPNHIRYILSSKESETILVFSNEDRIRVLVPFDEVNSRISRLTSEE